MSSRNTLSQLQGNHKVPATVIEGRKALVVQITWTSAPVIKTTVRRNFKLSVLAMDTRTWTPIQRGIMNLSAGQVIHYTQSDDHPGYYYITIVGESCTCVAGLYKQPCHHQTDAMAFIERKAYQEKMQEWERAQAEKDNRYQAEKQERDAEAFEKRVAWLAEQRQAKQEQQYQNLVA